MQTISPHIQHLLHSTRLAPTLDANLMQIKNMYTLFVFYVLPRAEQKSYEEHCDWNH